jgi:dethiobiotin synthetase
MEHIMKKVFFITGTDTGAGKTWITCHLLQAAALDGKQTLGLKPVSAGSTQTVDGLRHNDALLLQHSSTVKLPYEDINPYCLADPIAPHLAAQQTDVTLRAADIAQQVQRVIDGTSADYILIEGAGGWRVPLNSHETLVDFARLLDIPVIMVVGMKLGCINHALLTAETIRADGITLAGWVANDLGQPMPKLSENVATLEAWLPAPRIRMDQST